MVRHHIAQGARLFIERRSVFDSYRFSSGDLYIVDVVPVPDWFEQRITEAENEDVLHCFFAKIVVNPVHRFFVEYAVHHVIQYVCRFQVPPERLFQNNSRPPMLAAVQSYCSQTFNDWSRYRRGRRHIEQMVWARTILLHLLQPNAQPRIELRIVDVAYHVVQPLFEVLPSRLAKVACVFRLGGCLPCLLAKFFRTHRRAANPENFELRVHTALTCEVVETGNELALCEIARSSKNNEDTGISGWQRFLRQLLDGASLDNRRHKPLHIDVHDINFES